MKYLVVPKTIDEKGRSPCGERGLKFERDGAVAQHAVSLPVRGAWIEMSGDTTMRVSKYVAPRAGSVD